MSRKKKIPFKNLPKAYKLRIIINTILLLIGIACIGYFVFYINQANNTQNNYEKLSNLKNSDYSVKEKDTAIIMHLTSQEDHPDILEDYRTLYNNNKSLIGWIRIDGTLVDYPVMQSKSNDYYLNHNFNQEKDNNGSIFIDSECSIWPRSQNIIIYGHNMKSGKMFGQLKKYKSEEFYKKHPTIIFDTLYEKGLYQIIYAFSDIVYDETEVTFKYYQFIDSNSEDEWNSAMKYMSEKSLYNNDLNIDYGDEIITLSTCDYEKDAERFVIVARKI